MKKIDWNTLEVDDLTDARLQELCQLNQDRYQPDAIVMIIGIISFFVGISSIHIPYTTNLGMPENLTLHYCKIIITILFGLFMLWKFYSKSPFNKAKRRSKNNVRKKIEAEIKNREKWRKRWRFQINHWTVQSTMSIALFLYHKTPTTPHFPYFPNTLSRKGWFFA